MTHSIASGQFTISSTTSGKSDDKTIKFNEKAKHVLITMGILNAEGTDFSKWVLDAYPQGNSSPELNSIIESAAKQTLIGRNGTLDETEAKKLAVLLITQKMDSALTCSATGIGREALGKILVDYTAPSNREQDISSSSEGHYTVSYADKNGKIKSVVIGTKAFQALVDKDIFALEKGNIGLGNNFNADTIETLVEAAQKDFRGILDSTTLSQKEAQGIVIKASEKVFAPATTPNNAPQSTSTKETEIPVAKNSTTHLATYSAEIKGLKEESSQISREIRLTSEHIKKTKTELETLSKKIETTTASITNLEDKITTAKNEIAKYQYENATGFYFGPVDLASLETALSSAQGRLAKNMADQSSLKEEIIKQESTLSSLQKDKAVTRTLIACLKRGDLNKAQKYISAKNTKFNDIITHFNQEKGKLELSLKTLKSKNAELTNNITADKGLHKKSQNWYDDPVTRQPTTKYSDEESENAQISLWTALVAENDTKIAETNLRVASLDSKIKAHQEHATQYANLNKSISEQQTLLAKASIPANGSKT